jgi:isopentenyl-diphosphate delta-isomerase
MEEVILVDVNDSPMGVMEKMEAHQLGKLHRAFSIFVFNEKKELLLQQRAASKYHSGGLWTNTCCSHPRPQEKLSDAIHRRLQEEMGFDCELKHIFSFIYNAELDNDLIEHEYDHVFFGQTKRLPVLNPKEVMNYKFMSIEDIERDIETYPKQYTEWFKIAMKKISVKTVNHSFE